MAARKKTFSIDSWNVNGIRACAKKGFANWLGESKADAVCIQEVRATEEQIPDEVRSPKGWHTHFVAAERKGYSGVGIFSKQGFTEVSHELHEAYDPEGRLQFASFGDLLVVNGYFPNGNGKDRDNSRVPYKLGFYQTLFARLQADFEAGRPIVVVGDFNTAHEEIDLARPKQNVKTSGFLPEERAEFTRWIEAGWVDSFRHIHGPKEGHYTWWSQRFGVREKNIGWRIDYALLSPGAVPHLKDAKIFPDVMGSDHCPLRVTLERAVVGESFR